jgi:hypothetical protein
MGVGRRIKLSRSGRRGDKMRKIRKGFDEGYQSKEDSGLHRFDMELS